MYVYNVCVSCDKAGRTRIYSYDSKQKALGWACELLSHMQVETKDEMLIALKAKGKAFGRKDKKRFCIILSKNSVW